LVRHLPERPGHHLLAGEALGFALLAREDQPADFR
jgi:hypothetical protein